jgi:ribosomal protein S27E
VKCGERLTSKDNKMDNFGWGITCDICDTETDILVYGEDEKPVFCPMCGDDIITVEPHVDI